MPFERLVVVFGMFVNGTETLVDFEARGVWIADPSTSLVDPVGEPLFVEGLLDAHPAIKIVDVNNNITHKEISINSPFIFIFYQR